VPLAFAIALSLSLAILAQFVSKAHRPAVLIFCFAVLIEGFATFADVPRVTRGAIEILLGVVLCLYTFRHRSQLSPIRSSGWTWWKILAVIGLVVFVMLPPGWC
jgi:uncharacterized membrane-anchored protein